MAEARTRPSRQRQRSIARHGEASWESPLPGSGLSALHREAPEHVRILSKCPFGAREYRTECREQDSNLHGVLAPADFKSAAYRHFAIPAQNTNARIQCRTRARHARKGVESRASDLRPDG